MLTAKPVGHVRALFPLQVPSRARGLYKVAKAVNRLDGRAAATGRHLRQREVCVYRKITEALERASESVQSLTPQDAASRKVLSCERTRKEEDNWSYKGDYGVGRLFPQAHVVDLEKVDLPTATPQDALALLPCPLKEYYSVPRMKPLSDVQGDRACIKGKPEEYGTLIQRLYEAKTINLWSTAELSRFERHVTNGHFAVGKAGSDKQRLILDCRRGNAHMEIPPNPALPDRGSLGEPVLDEESEWCIGTTDLSVYFYTLSVPSWLEGIQGLPKYHAPCNVLFGGKTGLLWPTLRVTAMGSSHSLVIAQHVHRELWKVAWRLPSGMIDPRGPDPEGQVREVGLCDHHMLMMSAELSE